MPPIATLMAANAAAAAARRRKRKLQALISQHIMKEAKYVVEINDGEFQAMDEQEYQQYKKKEDEESDGGGIVIAIFVIAFIWFIGWLVLGR